MIEKQERRAMKKNDSINEKHVGENQDDSVVVDTSDTKFYDKELEEEQIRKLLFYEESFDKIKAVTGVSFLGDIIDKIKSQKESALELQQLTKQNQDFIEKLKKQKLDFLKRAEEKKLQECPVGSNRKVLDEKQDCLSER
jgi:Mg2+ and Co2+ transporter CorA